MRLILEWITIAIMAVIFIYGYIYRSKVLNNFKEEYEWKKKACSYSFWLVKKNMLTKEGREYLQTFHQIEMLLFFALFILVIQIIISG